MTYMFRTIDVALPTSASRYATIAIPDDGSDPGTWVDRLRFIFEHGTNGDTDAFVVNEYGEARCHPADSANVALIVREHASGSSGNIVEVNNDDDTMKYLVVSNAAATATVPVKAPNIPVDYARTSDAAAINNSDVLVADDVMTASLGVGTYIIEGMILYNGNQSADLKVRFNTTGTMVANGIGHSLTGTATTSGTGTISTLRRVNNADFTVGTADSGGNLNLGFGFKLHCVVTQAGVFTIQYAQNTAHLSDLVVMAGSHMSIRKINTP